MLCEKVMEDAICYDPERYLGEKGLKLIARQYSIGNYRFDILFEDRHGAKLIVEIQKGTLDREHHHKIQDYYEEYKVNNPKEYIELMVVANRIPYERRRKLSSLGIEYKEIAEADFTIPISDPQINRSSKNRKEILKITNNQWLFQSNPKRYKLDCVLKKEKCNILHWKVKETQNVTIGDIVYFFECGGLNQICAKGQIISVPAKIDKSDCEKRCLTKEFKEELRVKVKIIKVLDKPKSIRDLQDSKLVNGRILKYIINNDKSCPGSSFRLTEEEGNALDIIFAE
jgi:hypothetical protein